MEDTYFQFSPHAMSYWFPDWSAMEKREREREMKINHKRITKQTKFCSACILGILFPRGKQFLRMNGLQMSDCPSNFFTLMRSLSSCRNVNHMIYIRFLPFANDGCWPGREIYVHVHLHTHNFRQWWLCWWWPCIYNRYNYKSNAI